MPPPPGWRGRSAPGHSVPGLSWISPCRWSCRKGAPMAGMRFDAGQTRRRAGEQNGSMTLFTLGMRPFYLLAGAFAALAIPIRALQYTGWAPRTDAFWHAHEMLFGFAFAVIAGFLLTAVRNWTGRETANGPGLVTLVAIWVVARAMAFVS